MPLDCCCCGGVPFCCGGCGGECAGPCGSCIVGCQEGCALNLCGCQMSIGLPACLTCSVSSVLSAWFGNNFAGQPQDGSYVDQQILEKQYEPMDRAHLDQ